MVQLYKSSAINVVASLFRSARLFTRSEFHSTSLPVKRHSTFHKQILPLSPCQGASDFLREANFITSPPLSKRFGFSTQSEFYPPSAKGHPTFHAKRVHFIFPSPKEHTTFYAKCLSPHFPPVSRRVIFYTKQGLTHFFPLPRDV